MLLHLVLIKQNQQYWSDNEASPANGGFVHMANIMANRAKVYQRINSQGP